MLVFGFGLGEVEFRFSCVGCQEGVKGAKGNEFLKPKAAATGRELRGAWGIRDRKGKGVGMRGRLAPGVTGPVPGRRRGVA